MDNNWKDEDISAFAFTTGRQIEKIINDKTNNLEQTNKYLESKILNWYAKTRNQKFADYFDIKHMRDGKK